MTAIQGIYDGQSIIPMGNLPSGKRYKIIITFVEEITDLEDIRQFAHQSDAFEFWENEAEDIYQY